MICCKTVIGKGSPNKAGSHDVHGAALGEKEVAATREALGWRNAPFEIPAWAYSEWDGRAKGHATETAWRMLFSAYATRHPALAVEFHRRVGGELPADWSRRIETLLAETAARAESIATRKASQNAIEALAGLLPELLGGSADLTGSNLTAWPGCVTVEPTGPGNYIHYGVREFGMAAAINGIALHGGLIPFGGTFVMFSDYARNALRMAALMRVRSIFVLTHDSIGLGEDGPTHQPVEHAATLRYIPGLDVWRPCDTLETTVAWSAAVERRTGPTCLLLSRQSLPFQTHASDAAARIRRGGYVLAESGGMPQAVLIATGSEVAIAMQARSALEAEGISVRVVSMPSTTVFDRQTREYRSGVLPHGIPRVAIEAGITDFWRKYVGLEGVVLGIDTFGESAPAADLYRHFGLTVDNVVAAVKNVLGSDAAPAATERIVEAASIG